MVTSDFRPEVEIRPFDACAMHPAIITGTVRSLLTWLWGRYHVPQNAFLVLMASLRVQKISVTCDLDFLPSELFSYVLNKKLYNLKTTGHVLMQFYVVMYLCSVSQTKWTYLTLTFDIESWSWWQHAERGFALVVHCGCGLRIKRRWLQR